MIKDEPDYKRMLLAMFAAAVVMVGWQHFIHEPRQKAAEQYYAQKQVIELKEKQQKAEQLARGEAREDLNPNLTREQRLALSPRVVIRSDKLHGSISLRGARFDDLTLANYRESLEKDSKEVVLFTPNGEEQAYFAQLGWVSNDGTKVPGSDSLWQADKKELTAGNTVKLTWDNGSKVTFILEVRLDENYMFSVKQRVENRSASEISVAPYGYINRAFEVPANHAMISHEGPVGVFDGTLEELAYEDLRDKGPKNIDGSNGWLGVSDKYWLAALVPDTAAFKATFEHYERGGKNRYQASFALDAKPVESGLSHDATIRLFAGAKELGVLDSYAKGDAAKNIPPITLFDRAVDFGVLYFMTKPMFITLTYFYSIVGNFGIAILLLTILVKALLFPVANKSYIMMARMRELQPQMIKIKEKHIDDPIAMQKETMALYKREKVNPASGCLPLLIQIPIFFALYKVLYVTIEMRHAPFYGWIKDLSAADPSNIFTLFGLVDWAHPSWLHIGVLPILYCISMIIQMKQQPQPSDPVQAKVMTFMPYCLLVIMAPFSAGLILYWVWSNILSIIQQDVIMRIHKGGRHAHKAKKAAK